MTLEELLQEIGIEKIHLDNFAQNNPRLKYNIVIEHNENFAIDFQNGITQANLIDIDNNEKTITLKYKYKG